MFNWNVKQLFVYVTAMFETESNVRKLMHILGSYQSGMQKFNEIIIWDKIVQNRTGARLNYEAAFNKYPIIDQV